jgi:hypothetical protein
MTIRYQSGKRAEAELLATGKDVMRVVVPGLRDTLELRHFDGNWFTEDDELIEIDAMMAADAEMAVYCKAMELRANAAGRPFSFD